MNEPATHGDAYNFFGHCISARSNSPAMLERLRLMYSRFVLEGTRSEPDVALDIADDLATSGALEIRDPWWLYRLSQTDQHSHFTCQSLATDEFEAVGFCQPMVLVQNALLQTVAMAAAERYFFHAGALALDGRALLLAAGSRMGKTTLTLRMAMMGCGLLSDEIACIRKLDRVVDPFPRAVNVREETARLLGLSLDEMYIPSGTGADGREFTIDAEAIPGVEVSEPCEPAYLIFLKGFGDAARLQPLSKVRALFDLVSLGVAPVSDPSSLLFDLASLVEDMACYTLVIGDLDETARLLSELPARAAGAQAEAPQ